jgi:hypothetical protein
VEWLEVDVVVVGPCERLVDEVVVAVVDVGAVVQAFEGVGKTIAINCLAAGPGVPGVECCELVVGDGAPVGEDLAGVVDGVQSPSCRGKRGLRIAAPGEWRCRRCSRLFRWERAVTRRSSPLRPGRYGVERLRLRRAAWVELLRSG